MAVNARTGKLQGRDVLIAPTVLSVVGVQDGSNGPLLYTAEELRKSVPKWNGVPVTIDHPDVHGPAGGSAAAPEVWERQVVGTVFNTSFDGVRLKADLYLDVERLREVSPKTLDAVRNKRPMEVSTGHFSTQLTPSGMFNGKEYGAIVSDIVPNHLALLPDLIGACSIKDGCGMLRNSSPGLPLPVMSF